MADLEVVFDYKPEEESLYVDTVREYGGVILKGFLNSVAAAQVAREIMAEPFTHIDEWHRGGTVHEEYGLQEWEDVELAPPHTQQFGDHVGEMMRRQGVPFLPTAIRAQLYSEGKAGVDWHKDFLSSEQAVVVLNALGQAQFDMMIARYQVSRVLEVGDVAILAGSGLVPGVDQRVLHRVHAVPTTPEGTNQRLSVAFRQEAPKQAA